MTQILTAISALDQTKDTADQGALDEIRTQRDLYKTAFHAFADALKDLTQKKISLKERLITPLSGTSFNSPFPISLRQPHAQSTLPSAPNGNTPLLNEIEGLDERNDCLTHELIAMCSRQRDKYKEGLYQLKDAVAACQKDIVSLEEQLAVQKLISASKKTDVPDVCGSPEPAVSPNTLEQRQQIQMLRDAITEVKEGLISAKERDGALQNYIFLLFIQQKTKKDERVVFKTFNPTDMLPKDRELLGEVAVKAIKSMDPGAYPDYDLKKLFATKERNIDGRIKAIDFLREKFGKTDTGMAQLEGKARDIFGHFFSLLKRSEQDKSGKKKTNYGDFIFSHVPFLAADLLLAEKIYEECRAYYEKTRGPKDPQLVMIQEKIDQIKEVQRLFLILLENCQVS